MNLKVKRKIFVGREEYINKIIKGKTLPSSIVSLIGPGGSGKTQLAFKAMRKYVEDEKLFDMVIPIYFSRGSPPLSLLSFLKLQKALGFLLQNLKENPIWRNVNRL